jgi:serine/threonine protein kinase
MFGVTNEPTVEVEQARPLQSPTLQLPGYPAVGRVMRERYVLEARLGGGDRGAVFKAFDRLRSTLPGTYRYVALKILHAGGECSEQTLANLSLEFHCAQMLSHRNILNVYELDRDGDVVFSTMELLDGELLSNVLERLGPTPMRQSRAWPLIEQLGAGLAHAHERGIVHGDLKPRNIFITRDGEVRILGFGGPHRFEAVPPHPEEAHDTSASGTLAYASCEQLEGRRADPRDDLYALACIGYELLAGIHPFGSRPATVARNYRVGLVRPGGLAGRQWRALQKGLSWHRAGRSISVQAWIRRLLKQGMREQRVSPLHELTQPNQLPSRMHWQAAALFLIGILTAAGVLAGFRSTFARKSIDGPAPSVAANRYTPSVPLIEPPATNVLVSQPADSASKDNAPAAARAKPAARVALPAISVEPAPVRSDDHFAEIRLSRNLLQKNGSFTWWTEPATAKANVDYVPEAVAIQTFPTGFRATRLYVRLLPQALRSQRSYFYIAIAQTGPHQTPGKVIRRQVWLPASSSLQARR